jgi:SAM-dependent methyltransferase
MAPTPVRDHWSAYLERFHRESPGITETTFVQTRDAELGDPYDWLVAALPLDASRILDLGCGSSPVQPRLRPGTSYIGVDLSADELRGGRARGRGPTCRADARAIPLGDASVDAVVSCMSLMLVRPVEDALAEVARVLRPGGVLVALLPSAGPVRLGDVPVISSLALALRGPGSMPQRLTRTRISRLTARLGLEVVSASAHRFALPLEDADAADLAVGMLYTPGRDEGQRRRARRRLERLARPGRELPLPLLRLVCRRR